MSLQAVLKAQDHQLSIQKNVIEEIESSSEQPTAELTRLEEQLNQVKILLFKENSDSAKLIITPLIEELEAKNLMNSPLGLEARLMEASALELNNTRGEALEKMFSLIEDCKAKEEWKILSFVYLRAELAYEFLNKPDRCLYYFNQCIALIEKHNLVETYPRFCVRYSTYHRIWGDQDSSFYYMNEALRSSKILYEAQNGNFTRYIYEDITPDYATAHALLGAYYRDKGNLNKSKYYLDQLKLIWDKVGNTYSVTWAYLQLSWLYNSQGDYETALLYNDSCLLYGNTIYEAWGMSGKGLKAYTLQERAKLFKALNKPDSAYQYLNEGYQAEIEVIHDRNHLHATEVEARYTDQRKAMKIAQQNEQLDRERNWRLGLTGMLITLGLLTGGLIFIYLQLHKANHKTKIQAEELKQLDKVKSNFFANVSHELRTPLTLILGPLSYILDNPDKWEKENVQKQLRVMKRNGKNLMHLIEEILDISRLEANKLELEEENTPIIHFFEYLFFVFEPQFQAQGLDYKLHLDVNEDLHLLIDRKKFEKILNNFLSNAIKFTPKKGEITLSVRESQSNLQIKVTDTGKGIHPKDLPYIFDRFFQSKQANQKLYGGAGIGLALASKLARLMGGKVYAESTLGVGSTFYFELPKKVVAKEELPTPTMIELPKEEEIYSIGSDFTILVVEDNHEMRDFIYQLLQKKYKQVLIAKNGAEGLAILKEHSTNINLIVSDIMMPEMDGLTMFKEIKSHSEWQGIPVVMLTALAAERDKMAALTIGVDDYLTKPFSVPELLARVQNLLFNYHQRLEWKRTESIKEEEVMRPETKDTQTILNTKDKEWVDELTKLVEGFLGETKLDVEILAASVYLSSRQLNRKLKKITGLSPAKFIKEVQLRKARTILENGTIISISEVAYQVGFENYSTFSRVFKKHFGESPSTYLKKTKEK